MDVPQPLAGGVAHASVPLKTRSRRRGKDRDLGHKKLPRLPKDAEISKRPLLRPAIPSPYSGSDNQKVVYVSAKTPFFSAVKRVEKLLKLSDKRMVQSATTIAKQQTQSRKRKRGLGEDEVDDIASIAAVAEEKRRDGEAREEVSIKGTGKAVQKALELALWFQQRHLEYVVRLRTGSVCAIDDVEVDSHNLGEETDEYGVLAVDDTGGNEDTINEEVISEQETAEAKKRPDESPEAVTGTRIRYLSVMEVAVSLR